MYKIQNK